jgi:hypothetical protein
VLNDRHIFQQPFAVDDIYVCYYGHAFLDGIRLAINERDVGLLPRLIEVRAKSWSDKMETCAKNVVRNMVKASHWRLSSAFATIARKIFSPTATEAINSQSVLLLPITGCIRASVSKVLLPGKLRFFWGYFTLLLPDQPNIFTFTLLFTRSF